MKRTERARSAFGREGGRLGKSTAEMHSFVPRIEGRGGEASVAANTSGSGTVGYSTTMDHDTYLVEEVKKSSHANKTH